jgi:hypothetical protein
MRLYAIVLLLLFTVIFFQLYVHELITSIHDFNIRIDAHLIFDTRRYTILGRLQLRSHLQPILFSLFARIFQNCGISKNFYMLINNANRQSTQLTLDELTDIMVLLQKTLEPPKRFKLPKLIPDEKNVFN